MAGERGGDPHWPPSLLGSGHFLVVREVPTKKRDTSPLSGKTKNVRSHHKSIWYRKITVFFKNCECKKNNAKKK